MRISSSCTGSRLNTIVIWSNGPIVLTALDHCLPATLAPITWERLISFHIVKFIYTNTSAQRLLCEIHIRLTLPLTVSLSILRLSVDLSIQAYTGSDHSRLCLMILTCLLIIGTGSRLSPIAGFTCCSQLRGSGAGTGCPKNSTSG